MDAGLSLTALACALGVGRAWRKRRDLTLPLALAVPWLIAVQLVAAGASMATFVFLAALVNLVIAGIALAIFTTDPARRDAQAVGAISMAIMPAHWVMSVSNGGADWTLYAWSCNIGFAAQCLIAGGWFDGVGRSISRLVSRLRAVYNLRDGEV